MLRKCLYCCEVLHVFSIQTHIFAGTKNAFIDMVEKLKKAKDRDQLRQSALRDFIASYFQDLVISTNGMKLCLT